MSEPIKSAEKNPLPEFFRGLINEKDQPREFRGNYKLSKIPADPEEPYPLLDSLEIDPNLLSSTARTAFNALEASAIGRTDWADFKWKLTAFVHIQDIFDAVLYESHDELILFHQYYFYYESQYVLSESFLCGLNGFYIGANALLRIFLEFTILQNYYYRLTRETKSYRALKQYFKSGIHPSWGTILKRAIPKDNFGKLVRSRLESHLAGLSQSSLHPYHPDHSPTQHKSPRQAHSLEGVHFWFMTKLIVDAALWIYYINFPLLFQPLDIIRKFGHRGPLGLLIDEAGGAYIRRSLQSEDYERFKGYSALQSITSEMIEWYRGFPELSDDDIRATWNEQEDGKCPGLWEGYCQKMARLRALKRAMALRTPSDTSERIPDDLILAAHTLKGWEQISKVRRGG